MKNTALHFRILHLLFFTVFMSSMVIAQENCSNGIDDDGDGLIDSYDPDCHPTYDCVVQGQQEVFSSMAPEIHCSALLEAPSAYSSPIAGDVDGDGDVEVMVLNNETHRLVIISGVDCSVEAEISFPIPSFESKAGNIALGDVDADGYIDMFVAYGRGALNPHGIKRIEFDGTSYQEIWDVTGVATADRKHLDIIDVNQDGSPEIIPNGGFMVNSITGAVYTGALPAVEDRGKGLYAFTADADAGNNGNEGDVELILGVSIYRYDFTANNWNLIREIASHSGTWNTKTKVSLADLDLDGDIDAVVCNHDSNSYLAWDLQTTTIFAEDSFGGPPGISRAAIGNFDADPEPEFVFIHYNTLEAIDDIVSTNATVLGFSSYWNLSVTDPSAHTQVTLFDFDSDGLKEVVYRGETELFVYRGAPDGFGNPQQIYNSGASTITSETGIEYPVIVDANGDGQANILTFGDTNGSFGEGLHIFKSSGMPWAPARKIWNTQAYIATNVNDDGTIPAVMQENYLVYNDFLGQHGTYSPLPPDEQPASDLVMSIATADGDNGVIYDNCPDLGLALQICNQGDVLIGNNLNIEVYDGNPSVDASSVYVGTYALNTPIDSSECIVDTLFFTPNASSNYDFHFFINHNDPSGVYPLDASLIERDHLECDYTNNTFSHAFSCNRPPVLVEDNIQICSEISHTEDVLQNDSDVDNNIDVSTLTILTAPENGTASIVAGEIEYTSDLSYIGLDSLEYQVSDTGTPVFAETAWLFIDVMGTFDTGVSSSVTLCQTQSPVDLITLLGGTPDAGGEWQDEFGNPRSNSFDPSVESGQVLTYTSVTAGACTTPSTITISIVSGAGAGTGGTFTLCSSGGAVSMLSFLTGVGSSSGSWYDSSSNAVSSIFNPAVTSAGDYIYVLPAQGFCPADTAFVTVIKETPLEPGSNENIEVCNNALASDLFDSLGGTPDTGGVWTDPSGNNHTGSLDPSVDVGGNYTYTHSATAGCPMRDARVFVDVTPINDTGGNASVSICENTGTTNLFNALTGSLDTGGYWLDSNTDPHSGNFDSAVDAGGVYTYNFNATGGCPLVSSDVTVTLDLPFDPGTAASHSYCETDGTVNMFGLLSGTPDNNGTWTFSGSAVSFTDFDPQTESAGDYVYTTPANGACISESTTVSITVNTAPDAGDDSSLAVCESNSAVSLYSLLDGTPMTGGQWFDAANIAINDSYIPNTPGNFTFMYEVTGTLPCGQDQSTLSLEVQDQLSAGTGDTYDVCENMPVFDLNDGISSDAEAGGVWYDTNSNIFDGVIDPSTSLSGNYTFEVQSPAQCTNLTAQFTVNIEALPNAGANGGTAFYCNVFPGFDLLDHVPGNPQSDGYFTDPNGDEVTDLSSPMSYESGEYIYHANPVNVCPETTIILDVSIAEIGSAGIDTDVLLCENIGEIDLTSYLNGSPEASGQWVDENSNSITNLYTPTSSVTLSYSYNGGFPCPTISSDLTIDISTMTYAGAGASVTSCEIDANYNLNDQLDATASSAGYWQDPNGSVITNTTIDPDASLNGDYSYLTTPNAACPQDTAVFTVFTQSLPNAGEDGSLLACSVSGPVNMLGYLQGNPDPGGNWIDPNGNLTSPDFNPSADTPGSYTYEVMGTTPCPANAASATVQIVNAPFAGNDVTMDLCSEDPILDVRTLVAETLSPETHWLDENFNEITNPIEDPSDLTGSMFMLVATGDAPCVNDTSFFTIGVQVPAEISQLEEIVLCSEGAAIDIYDYVTLQNEESVVIKDANSIEITSTFDPAVMASQNLWVVANPHAPCTADSLLVEVIVHEPANPGEDNLIDICSFDAPINPFDYLGGTPDEGGLFVWMNDTTSTLTIDPSENSGTHFIEYIALSEAPCDSYSSWLQVDIHQSPEPDFSINDEEAQLSDPIYYFENETSGTYNFTWDFGGIDTSSAFDTEYTFPVDVSETYLVCLYATDVFGCDATTCQDIEVKDILSHFIPNTFTPNNDGDNDVFLVRGRGIDTDFFEMFIYSRNGDQVFHTNDPLEGWDGTWFGEHVPTDMYSYRIILKAKDTSERKELMGKVTLLR